MFYYIVTIWITATPITGRDVKDLSLDFFYLSFSTKINVSIYQKGWQFSCYQITGRHVKDLSPENIYFILLSTKVSVSLYQNDGSSAATYNRKKC